jgi:hypothetical protein
MHKGSCLCSAVCFEVTGDLGPAWACHCTQCRKQTGHYIASTEVPRPAVVVNGEDKITWYQASSKARRGFCSVCGSFLFWDPADGETMWIAMGAFDKPSGTHLARHIYVADKGDYYDIADGLPQSARSE